MPRPLLLRMGGTFDPFHRGHLESARELVAQLQPDEFCFMPCYKPGHRVAPVADAQQRLAMLRLATETEPGLGIDDREYRRETPSYTVNTLEDIRREVGDEVALAIVIGSDAWSGLSQWHRWRDLQALSHVVVLERAGMPRQRVTELSDWEAGALENVEALRRRPAGELLFLQLQPWPVSATDIRRRLSAGESVKDWLAPAVRAYIEENSVYGSSIANGR